LLLLYFEEYLRLNYKYHQEKVYKKVMQGFQLESAVEEAKKYYERLEKIANEYLTKIKS
jgi:hypothetical protein